MKKSLLKVTSAILAIVTSASFAVGCDSEPKDDGACRHAYAFVAEKEAKCDEPGYDEHYACERCGLNFVKGENDEYIEVAESELARTKSHTWLNGKKTAKVDATCYADGVKEHYYCTVCEKNYILKNGFQEASDEDLKIEKTAHKYRTESVRPEYLYEEASETSPAKYQKSCTKCGAAQDKADVTEGELFTVGKTLAEYREASKADYTPRSLSVSLYDAESVTYGFTWNTDQMSVGTTLYYCVGSTFNADTATKVNGYSEKFSSYTEAGDNTKEAAFDYYVSKVEVQWQPNTTYSYRVADRYVGNVNDATTYTIKTVDPNATSFTFSHLSDSQTKENSGVTYGKILNQITSGESAFVLHTGDVVEYSRYEDYWTQMLDTNAQYLSRIPVMALSGNHDTTYKSGTNSSETYKHFHYLLPEQDVGCGIYYAFTYGKVRFIMLNTNFSDSSATKLPDKQYKWLKAELESAKEKEESGEINWTIVSMHNPIYSAGKWGSDPSRNQIAMGLKSQLTGLFEENGVDIVLQGHDHCVTKRVVNGVTYLMNGTAGTSAGAFCTSSGTLYKASDYDYSLQGSSSTGVWAEISVSESSIGVKVKQLTVNGASTSYAVKQQWSMSKR